MVWQSNNIALVTQYITLNLRALNIKFLTKFVLGDHQVSGFKCCKRVHDFEQIPKHTIDMNAALGGGGGGGVWVLFISNFAFFMSSFTIRL